MGFVSKVLEWLSFKPKKIYQKWDPNTNPIDVHKIESDLRLKEEGARLGAAGVPVESETALCGPEAQSVLAIEAARTDYLEWGQLRLMSLNNELARLDVTPLLTSAAQGAEEFERLAGAAITSNAAEINQLQATAESRQRELDRFRAEHKLTDLPHYPIGLGKAYHWTAAIFLIVVDALLNASFFAKGLSGGLIEGFKEAGIAALINVSCAMFFGFCGVRFVNHSKLALKLYGIFMTLLAGCCIAGLALAVAHYRDALVLGLDQPQSAAIKTLLESPFNLTEIQSWLLFMIGSGFGVLAVFDGYKLDDPYPGYGKRHRNADESRIAYTEAIDALQEHLEQVKDEMLAKIDYAHSHAAAAIVSYKNVISDKERCGDTLAQMISDSQAMLTALLATFRDENKVARREKGYGIPASFNLTPSLRKIELPDFNTAENKMNLAAQEMLLSDFSEKSHDIRARIQAAFNTNFNSLHTLSSHFTGVPIISRAPATTESKMMEKSLS